MDSQKNITFVENFWEASILPTLMDYIRIPNKSPLFDAQWEAHGHMDKAVELIVSWYQKHAVADMKIEVMRLPGRTPLIIVEIPGNSDATVLLYGHLDKQPEMTGWDDDLSPWQPVLKEHKLYGRGSADDGYAAFAALAAIQSLHAQQLPHARCIILIEACEESGSYDLPHYMQALEKRIGIPSLIICLDSGCGNYEQLWVSTSLRGLMAGTLHIEVLKQGIHSGDGGGIVPASFSILRELLDRIENKTNGQILLQELFVDIPKTRIQQAELVAKTLGNEVYTCFAFQEKVQPLSSDLTDLILNRTWRPALAITGAEGLPHIESAGNVLLPSLTVKLSVRLPPTCDAQAAIATLKATLEKEPPFAAKIHFQPLEATSGWNAPQETPWAIETANVVSQHYYGRDAMYMGEGGSIPFMGILGKKFPHAQFFILGVLGPHANAHGPNEFLHIPMAKRLTCCVAEILAKHQN